MLYKRGSSGSPILLINNQKLIGIHYGCSNLEFNKGTLLIYAIIELKKIKNNILLINEKGKYIENKNTINNYIIAEINIQENNQNERIINSYEEAYINNIYFGDKKEYKNEKEIKENKDKLNNKYIELDDSIINYFKLNKSVEPNYLNNKYDNESIYIINYPKNKDIVVSYGKPPKLKESEINHYCSTK